MARIVQCLLERKGGSIIDLFGKSYHFKPNELGHHIAEVSDEKAYKRFVKEIPEAYCKYDPDKVLINKEKADKVLSKKKWDDDAHRRKNTATGRPATGPVEDVTKELDGTTVETKTPEELAQEAAAKTKKDFHDPYTGTSNDVLRTRIEGMSKVRVHHATGREKLVNTLIDLELMEADRKAAEEAAIAGPLKAGEGSAAAEG